MSVLTQVMAAMRMLNVLTLLDPTVVPVNLVLKEMD